MTTSDRDAIDALYARWRKAVEAADIPGYVSVLHPDVRLMPPGAPDIVSAASYGAFLGPVFQDASYRIEVLAMPEIEVLGDAAVARYEYAIHLSLKDPSRQISEPGALTASRTASRYFDVLRRIDDGGTGGSWRVWRHTWNASALE